MIKDELQHWIEKSLNDIANEEELRALEDSLLGDFSLRPTSCSMQRSCSIFHLRIYICTVGDKELGNFLVTPSRIIQRSSSIFSLRIHIRPSSQVLFDGFNVPIGGSFVN
jgi:hypothetical protein